MPTQHGQQQGEGTAAADSSNAGAGGVGGGGAVRQALCSTLAAELADFYRLMAVLEAHASQPMPAPGAGVHSRGWWEEGRGHRETVS